jgi:hypothetical protein
MRRHIGCIWVNKKTGFFVGTLKWKNNVYRQRCKNEEEAEDYINMMYSLALSYNL